MSDKISLLSTEYLSKLSHTFSVCPVEEKDIPSILNFMDELYEQLPEKSWFSMDSHENLVRYMTSSGFALKAESGQDNEQKKLAAVFVARTSDLGAENLGTYLNLATEQLTKVAHMEIAMVHSDYRGNGLQKKLMEIAEEYLKSAGFQWLMGTAHPENIFSVQNFQKLGYRIVLETVKYGGLPRYVFCKQLHTV